MTSQKLNIVFKKIFFFHFFIVFKEKSVLVGQVGRLGQFYKGAIPAPYAVIRN